MAGLRVLVVGASIAGPTTAYWLAKAGASVTVIERFPNMRKGGQNIDIRTAGVTVMRKMPGMEEAVRAKVVPIEGLSFVRDDGRPYGIIKMTGDSNQQGLLSEYEIFRDDLAQILYDMTKEHKNIKYVFGEQVAAMQQIYGEDGPIVVEFVNGTSDAEFDLVVACDGATSRTRAIGLGCSVQDFTKSTNCWSAYFTIEKDILEGSRIEQGISSPRGRFCSVLPVSSTESRVALTSVNSRSNHAEAMAFREASKQGEDALKRYITQKFGDMGWKLDQIMDEMISSKDFYASEIIQVRPPCIFRGRFIMVGDAGYAAGPTGGGTTLALAGGYILAGEIGKHAGDVEAGLKGYEETMRPLIKDMQKIPPFGLTILAPQTAWAIWIRNSLFAFVTWTGVLNFIQKYFANAFANVEEFPLPEYTWVG